MTKITNPEKGFHLEVKILYDIEKQLEAALLKMAAAATDPELAKGFEMHLEETKVQSERLERIFEIIGQPAEKHAVEAIRGLIADGQVIASAEGPDALRDAMLAGAARDVEHYEMACYMNAIEEAKALGLDEVVDLLEETLAEEEATDEKLMAALKMNLEVASAEAAAEAEEEQE